MSDLAVRWFGVVVAAMAGIVLLIAAFAPWWGVGQSTITGWGAFGGGGKAVIVAVVVAGFLLGPVAALPVWLAHRVTVVLSGIALGGALLIVWHLSVQTVGFVSSGEVTTGAPLATGSCLAIAGAAMLTAQGTGLWRERIRSQGVVLVLIGCGCVGLLVSLFLPGHSTPGLGRPVLGSGRSP